MIVKAGDVRFEQKDIASEGQADRLAIKSLLH
jgi:hypothetical protein